MEGISMPMKSNTDIGADMQEVAQDAVNTDGPFVPGVLRTDVTGVEEFGDFEYYAWELYYTKGKGVSVIRNLFSAVSKLEEFVEQSNGIKCSANDIGERDAKKFKKWLTDEVKNKTAVEYINELDRMAQFYLSKEYYSGNPFSDLAEGINTSDSRDASSSFQGNERITVDDSRLREAIQMVHGTQLIVLLTVLVKTGIRVSEACNLDWEDINLDHSLADDLLPTPRTELSGMPDHIYIDPAKTEETYDSNTEGNKRKVGTDIPIDGELKRLLLWHALVRERRFDDQNPVFMTNDCPQDESSTRLGLVTAWSNVTDWADEYDDDWYDSDRGEKKNITPHWFRAKFSSYMTRRLEAIDGFDRDAKDIVKGQRGDVGQDVLEDYRLRPDYYSSIIRSQQFKIGLEGV
jgi:integrase